jgi:hypothetical protein
MNELGYEEKKWHVYHLLAIVKNSQEIQDD